MAGYPTTPRVSARRGVPEIPEQLATDAELEHWHRACREMKSLGVLATADGDIITRYVQACAIADAAYADIQERGHLVPGERGLVKNQSLQVWRDSTTTAANLADKCGLTPAGRAKLPVSVATDDETAFDADSFGDDEEAREAWRRRQARFAD